jgi:hypothetical protein
MGSSVLFDTDPACRMVIASHPTGLEIEKLFPNNDFLAKWRGCCYIKWREGEMKVIQRI